MRPDTYPTRAALPPDVPHIPPELIDAYVRRGRELQAEALWRGLRALGARLRALARGARPAARTRTGGEQLCPG